jgi:hypothetical protein
MNTVPQKSADTPDAGHSAAATLHLMLHYARRPCPLLAHAIARQLFRLSQACSDGSSLTLQEPAALRDLGLSGGSCH